MWLGSTEKYFKNQNKSFFWMRSFFSPGHFGLLKPAEENVSAVS